MLPCRCSFGNFLYPLRMCYCKYLKNMFVRKMWQIRVKKWKISWSEGGWWRSRSERWKLMWPATFGEDFYSLPIAYFRSWCTFAPNFFQRCRLYITQEAPKLLPPEKCYAMSRKGQIVDHAFSNFLMQCPPFSELDGPSCQSEIFFNPVPD